MASIKNSLANKFADNQTINKKALQIKKSWDEVYKIIHTDKSKKIK